MRIAIFSDTFVPEVNGVAKTLKRYTDYLDENGIEYKLFIPESRKLVPKVPDVHRFMSIPFILYPDCRLALPNPLDIKQSLEAFQPDVIHIATPFNLGLYGLHYGKKLNIPMVASYHTNFDNYLEYYHLQYLNKWLWKYMTWFHRPFKKVYVPSISTKEKLLKNKVHTNLEIWGRGVNQDLFSPAKKSDNVRKKYNIKEENIVLYVGRVAPEKNLPIVIKTFRSLPEHIQNNTRLLIVGDGPLLENLSETETQNITYTGFLQGEELAEVYASSDLFLFPSTTETFGNVVLEAMSSGLSVIGANEGGVKHLINDGVNGYVCNPKKIDEFIEKTTILLENKKLRETYAQKAREYALTKSWDNIFDMLILSCRNAIDQQEYRLSITGSS